MLTSLRAPSTSEVIGHLSAMGALPACVLLGGGLVCLLQGGKLFKIVIVVNAAMLGGLIGSYLAGFAGAGNVPLYGGLAGGAVLAAIALPLMKYAVSVMGGLAGCFAGFVIWRYAANAAGQEALAEHAWAGGLIGLITLALLAFLIMKATVMIFTSIQGAVMGVCGLLGLLLKSETLQESLLSSFDAHPYLLPLAIVVPAIIGFSLQYATASKKAQKKKKALEGGGQ